MDALYRLKLECATPKYRELSEPADDILVVLPQCLYAVFDRATSTGRSALNDRIRSSTGTTAAIVEDAGDCLHFLVPSGVLFITATFDVPFLTPRALSLQHK